MDERHDGRGERKPGGTLGDDPAIANAALAAAAGIDPLRLLETSDDVEALVIAAISKERLRVAELDREDLAVRIANAVGKAFGA